MNGSIDADSAKKNGQPKTGIKSDLLGFLADHDPPINGEQPNAVCEMPRRRKDTENVKK